VNDDNSLKIRSSSLLARKTLRSAGEILVGKHVGHWLVDLVHEFLI